MVDYITVAVTLLLGIVGLCVNNILQRRAMINTTITQTRINEREKIQNAGALLLTVTDTAYLQTINAEESAEHIREIAKAEAEFRILFTFSNRADMKLCLQAKELTNAAFAYLKDASAGKNLVKAREEFIYLLDSYIQADWSRIKGETTGKNSKKPKELTSWEEKNERYKELYKEHSNEP